MGVDVAVKLYKAVDLPSADMNGKSDPYVVFKINNTTHKSSIISANLNPVWEPAPIFHFHVEDPVFSVLEVQVYDYDRFTQDDLIGSVSIGLGQFVDQKEANVMMHSLDIPSFFERQNRKSVIMLEIKLEPGE